MATINEDIDGCRKRKAIPEQRESQRKGKTDELTGFNCHAVHSLQLLRFVVSCAALSVR